MKNLKKHTNLLKKNKCTGSYFCEKASSSLKNASAVLLGLLGNL